MVDPDKFWSDEARRAKIRAKIQEELVKRFGAIGANEYAVSKELLDAIEKDVAAQEGAAQRHSEEQDK